MHSQLPEEHWWLNMDREYDLYGIIRDIIIEQTRYLRHYIAKVENNNDPDMKGKVFVTVPALGWDTPDKGQWAIPRHMHGLSVPAIGEYVEVYFINGSVHSMAYIGMPMEVLNMIPKNYTSNFDHVLFEAPGDPNTTVKYNENTKQFDIKATKIVFNDGTEPFVKGTTAQTQLNVDMQAMQTLQAGINAWAPVAMDGGAALKVALATFLALSMADYSNILSTEIMGK